VRKICSTAILLLVSVSHTFANDVYIDIPADNLCEFGTGWANYCDPRIVVEEKKAQEKETLPQTIIIQAPQAKEPPKDPNDPIVWLENYQEAELRARARMTMEPSQENVDAYRREFFNDTMDRGTLVSDYWRRGAWQNPEFDYTLKRPVGYLAKNEYDAQRENTAEETVKALNERYGIFFVFRTSNPQSVKAAAVVDSFASKHDLYIRGVSLDGKPLPTWNRPWIPFDDEVKKKLNYNENYDPGVLLFDRETQNVVPIGYGILAHDELANRVYVLTQVKVGEDF